MSGEQQFSYHRVLDNSERPCPPELLARQVCLEVRFKGFDGSLHSGIIEVHEDAAADVVAFFVYALSIGFPIEKVTQSSHPDYLWDDDKLMAANATSGFNYRTIAGTDKISKHAFGAFDVNPKQNPYIRYEEGQEIVSPPGAEWDPVVPGTLYSGHPLVIFMKDHGWEWGGEWTPDMGKVDFQHFEISRKPHL